MFYKRTRLISLQYVDVYEEEKRQIPAIYSLLSRNEQKPPASARKRTLYIF